MREKEEPERDMKRIEKNDNRQFVKDIGKGGTGRTGIELGLRVIVTEKEK